MPKDYFNPALISLLTFATFPLSAVLVLPKCAPLGLPLHSCLVIHFEFFFLFSSAVLI
jgi:hypothetical protein